MKIQVKKDVDEMRDDMAKLYYEELRQYTDDHHPNGITEAKEELLERENDYFGKMWTGPANIWGVTEGLADPEKFDLKPTRKLQYMEDNETVSPKIYAWNSKGEKSIFRARFFAEAIKVFQTIVGYGAADIDVYSGDTKPIIIHVKPYEDAPTNIEDYSIILSPCINPDGDDTE